MTNRPESEVKDLPRAERTARIDLGLAISRRACRPGFGLLLNEIAAFCGTTDSAIQLIEQRALRNLRFRFQHDPVLQDLMEALFRK